MSELKNQGNYVFGLDIGTRSIVGTVGYKDGDIFHVVGQEIKEHETRAMLDGQIHDIGQVGNTISQVKRALEKKLDIKLEEVCIAAAGRVLRTIETSAEWEFDKETVVSVEEIASLTSLAIEKAYEQFQETNDTGLKFYCVGNSVIRYYLNGYQISNLENHKARKIGLDLIATFLPDDVVDGLYKAVELAGLTVANMTLEPIAAISVAIPEMYRMLNIALVDVGAGTSDICITKDGCIIAYGMIPTAGDSLTEILAQNCLVDFATAETIKIGAGKSDQVEYKDIMGLPQTISKESILSLLNDQIEKMTNEVSDKIKELNGDKAVSAVFVVGGGGRIPGYTDKLSEHLGIIKERVAVRGEEVMQKITFADENSRRDSLMVTPIGICLNYYEQSNNFIYVTFNDERVKLYDNNALAVVDAAMHTGFPNERLFPRRGAAINYTVNGVSRIARGKTGEPAEIRVNGEAVDLYHEIKANDVITVKESTMGPDAVLPIAKVPEVKGNISVKVNGSKVLLPKLPLVNGDMKTLSYDVQDGDRIVMLDYYTIKQVKEFMDIENDPSLVCFVNNEEADDSTLVYDNFAIKWEAAKEGTSAKKKVAKSQKTAEDSTAEAMSFDDLPEATDEDIADMEEKKAKREKAKKAEEEKAKKAEEEKAKKEEAEKEKAEVKEDKVSEPENKDADNVEEEPEKPKLPITIAVIVNSKGVVLKGKPEYVFVDIFDYIEFDRSSVGGKNLVTKVNGKNAGYLEAIHDGDVIEIGWED